MPLVLWPERRLGGSFKWKWRLLRREGRWEGVRGSKGWDSRLPCCDRLYCVHRRFGTKCAGCAQGISPSDLVRKARSKVFHLNCFTCMVCNKQLSTGEELYVIDENKFVCKDDYLNSSSLKEGSLNSGRRPLPTQPKAMPSLAFPTLPCVHSVPCSELQRSWGGQHLRQSYRTRDRLLFLALL